MHWKNEHFQTQNWNLRHLLASWGRGTVGGFFLDRFWGSHQDVAGWCHSLSSRRGLRASQLGASQFGTSHHGTWFHWVQAQCQLLLYQTQPGWLTDHHEDDCLKSNICLMSFAKTLHMKKMWMINVLCNLAPNIWEWICSSAKGASSHSKLWLDAMEHSCQCFTYLRVNKCSCATWTSNNKQHAFQSEYWSWCAKNQAIVMRNQ